MTLVDLARDLAEIPSHDDPTAAGDEIEARLRDETDAVVERDDAGNVLARRGTGDTSLALVGHHDVVEPADRQRDGDAYVVTIEDDRLHGRGTADMKGALAAMLHAFRDADPAGELVFASFVGEEVGGVGSQHAIDDGFSPDYAVVGEGSTGYSGPDAVDVAVAHKGRRGITVTATGRAAHASEPAAGENAVYRACDAVDELRDLEAPTVTVAGEDLTGSVAVTGIEGGDAWNVIPESCRVTVDERTVPGARADVDRVESVPGVTWRVDQDWPPMECDDDTYAAAVLDAARATGDAALVTKPHATDAGWLAAAGTTCVICGPAELGEAHTASESVSVPVLRRCRRIYERIAEAWPA